MRQTLTKPFFYSLIHPEIYSVVASHPPAHCPSLSLPYNSLCWNGFSLARAFQVNFSPKVCNFSDFVDRKSWLCSKEFAFFQWPLQNVCHFISAKEWLLCVCAQAWRPSLCMSLQCSGAEGSLTYAAIHPTRWTSVYWVLTGLPDHALDSWAPGAYKMDQINWPSLSTYILLGKINNF